MTIEFQKFLGSNSAKRASLEGEMALRSMGWTVRAGVAVAVGVRAGAGAGAGAGVGFGGNFSAILRSGSAGSFPFFA